MIGKCIASQANATFFSISASSLTSKWVGESEKMMRALFAVARCHQPAVIFIDEIDSMLCARTDGEVESSRRLKTEFLVQFDGVGTSSEDRILVIGATNRPQELDEAARRRFSKRLYIPLPEASGRKQLVSLLMSKEYSRLSEADLEQISVWSEGYSGSDLVTLCREASYGPMRIYSDISTVSKSDVRPILLEDFKSALSLARASVSKEELTGYVEWNAKFGSIPNQISK